MLQESSSSLAKRKYYMYAWVHTVSGSVQLELGTLEAPPVVTESLIHPPCGVLTRPPEPLTHPVLIHSTEPRVVVVVVVLKAPCDKAVVVPEAVNILTAPLRVYHPGPIASLVHPSPVPIPALAPVVPPIVISMVIIIHVEFAVIAVEVFIIKTGPVAPPVPPPHVEFSVILFFTAIVSPPSTVVQAVKV